MELQSVRQIKLLKSDNREEYKSDLFLQLCRDKGIELMKALSDISQLEELRNKMEWQKDLMYLTGGDTVLVVKQWAE